MAGKRQTPTVRLRRLAAELRTLRTSSGLTRDAVVERTGINVATLYRIEHARVRPQTRTLRTLLDLYGADEAAAGGAGRPAARRPSARLAARLPVRTARAVHHLHRLRRRSPQRLELRVPVRSRPAADRGLRPGRDPGRAALAPAAMRSNVASRYAWSARTSCATTIRSNCGASWTKQRSDDRSAARPSCELSSVTSWRHPSFRTSRSRSSRSESAHMRACRARSSSCSSPKRAIPDVIYIDSMAGDLFLEAEADVRRYRLVFEHLRAVAASPDASRVAGRGPRRGDVRRKEVRHARAGPLPCPVAQEQPQQRQRPVRRGSPPRPKPSPSATPRTLTDRS